MTATSNSEFDRSEFVLAVLEWLEDHERDVPTETVDQAFDVLASERRRLFLNVMRCYGESITLPDAAEEVAVRETGDSVQELSAEHVADVYISLYHDHLPRLVGTGLVEYDQERDLVSPVQIQ
ncbi:DUF7344 domain-containing protein [Natronobacterium texcoconense]|uniref:DUF7344 domain-containing protein n=1 Tax=Natronobacterium texcoconense TaxID=1095778 RepID=A0A1H0ZYL5_NATTX|nr:hypothetical protein [Natronobacterium texcoconense]SDQ32525.1 hypothetical protein SAMN04489842_0489 [Natronobacterium texcoconense]